MTDARIVRVTAILGQGLRSKQITPQVEAYLAMLVPHLDTPEPPPHVFTIDQATPIPRYLLNGKAIKHNLLARRALACRLPGERVAANWLRNKREDLDRRIQSMALAPDALKVILQDIEMVYLDSDGLKDLREAYLLGIACALISPEGTP